MENTRKIRKIKSNTLRWQRLAKELAFTYCPEIYPCRHCGRPVVKGYCCGTCESDNP